MRINPRQVEAFHKVILTGGVTSAANMMNITQPAVSRLIRDFEYAVNLKLFNRDGRGLEPRDEAMKLYREVERLYLGLEHIARIADEIRHSKGSVLRIATVHALSSLCANEIFPTLLEKVADISLFLDIESTNHITDVIASNQYDIGFVFGHAGVKGLEAELLAQANAVAVLSAEHVLAGADAITLDDLTRYRSIIPGRKTPLREQIEQQVIQQQLYLHSPIETSLANCCTLAANNSGIGIVDSMTALNYQGNIIIKPFLPEITIAYLALYPPQIPKSLLVEQITGNMRCHIAAALAKK
jgi:DNA-binding transcriptional LysR family regulator